MTEVIRKAKIELEIEVRMTKRESDNVNEQAFLSDLQEQFNPDTELELMNGYPYIVSRCEIKEIK